MKAKPTLHVVYGKFKTQSQRAIRKITFLGCDFMEVIRYFRAHGLSTYKQPSEQVRICLVDPYRRDVIREALRNESKET